MKDSKFLYASISGLLYFLLTASVEYAEGARQLFTGLMIFLPGLTFPLVSTKLYSNMPQKNALLPVLHCFLSVAIYYGAVWLFSGQGYFFAMPVIAGFSGSFLYLMTTILLLGCKVSKPQVAITTLRSGLAFIPYLLFQTFFCLGLAIFLWTVVNAYILCGQKTTATAL